MSDYRTPAEYQATAEHEARVQRVLNQAVTDGASLLAAIALGEPADVVERWVDAYWNGLRDSLRRDTPCSGGLLLDDRLTAITLLLKPRIDAEYDAILRSMRETP